MDICLKGTDIHEYKDICMDIPVRKIPSGWKKGTTAFFLLFGISKHSWTILARTLGKLHQVQSGSTCAPKDFKNRRNPPLFILFHPPVSPHPKRSIIFSGPLFTRNLIWTINHQTPFFNQRKKKKKKLQKSSHPILRSQLAHSIVSFLELAHKSSWSTSPYSMNHSRQPCGWVTYISASA